MTIAPRTGQAAIDYTWSRVGNNVMSDSGLCLQFVRQDYGLPGVYPSAIEAWYATIQHSDDRNPPPAVPVWFWSSSPYRHIAFYCGDGTVITTYNDDVRAYSSIAQVESVFGTYMGWGETLNNQTVYVPIAQTPEPKPEERRQQTMWIVSSPNWGQVYITDVGGASSLDGAVAGVLREGGIVPAYDYDADSKVQTQIDEAWKRADQMRGQYSADISGQIDALLASGTVTLTPPIRAFLAAALSRYSKSHA